VQHSMFHTVDSNMWLSDTSTQRIHCCIYTAENLCAGAMRHKPYYVNIISLVWIWKWVSI